MNKVLICLIAVLCGGLAGNASAQLAPLKPVTVYVDGKAVALPQLAARVGVTTPSAPPALKPAAAKPADVPLACRRTPAGATCLCVGGECRVVVTT